MPLSNQHLVRNATERNIGKQGMNRAACLKQFNRADMLLQSVIADIVNGFTRNDIILKFKNQDYEYQKKSIGESQAKNYISMAYKVMAEDRVEEQDKLRDQLYGQYLMLYNDCVINGNNLVAKQILDSMAKIFLPQAADTSIRIDSAKDGITIKFGFNDNNDSIENS